MSISNYAENKILDHVLRNVAFTSPTSVYVSLHSADPGETGANEISGGSYVRKVAAFTAAASGATETSATLTWSDMPAVTLTHVAIWDASTAGNCLWVGALSSAKVVNSGDTFQMAAGDLDVTLD